MGSAGNSGRRHRVDARLVLGILLVAGSVAGVFTIVSSSDRSVTVYAAQETLSPGDRITAADLLPSSVSLGPLSSRYLSASDLPAEGVIVVRPVAAGELVPVSAVGDAAGLRLASVVVRVGGGLAEAVAPGGQVEVWASPHRDAGSFGPPIVIVSEAMVVRLLADSELVIGSSATDVELLIPRPDVARVLDALANREAISLVPATIPLRG